MSLEIANGLERRCLVTGGGGFLGSHLCERLLAQGCEVYGLDNYCLGENGNLSGLISHPRFELIRHDVTVPLHIKVDEIYNLACPASPVHYQIDPVQTTKTAVLGAINMLELARRLNARILQASTSEVYGDPEVHPQIESYVGHVNPVGPRACYDEGKRCAESLFFDYRRQYGIDIRVARIFNTYGPRMNLNDGRVVPNFIVQALTNQPITIFGDGSQTRSFGFVDDVIDGLIKLMRVSDQPNGPINIGNPAEYTINELAEMITRISGSRSPLVYQPLPQDDPIRRRPDISLGRKILGWEPRVPLERGLRKTIECFGEKLISTTANAYKQIALPSIAVTIPNEAAQ